ncbi:DUF948 domain-containing protein [Bacillus salipaludis]|uniref:DUF948 domain-containing protein n=1 Tax=Bacillus salipaludis TaxID=2547811 RepID=A0A4R5VS82_9BACI|nr:DUF948 domain-containing protein [Bacillus salipaludis]MDQ6599959.1 DUF948 domain-containing protein [Bacillus salipaludis]TDK61437.1 DUF948 domain-containing protein [Bacillus salipaludis]
MIIILYLSVALIAIAFLVLVIYVSKMLTSLRETLKSVSKTLEGLETQLEGVTTETTVLLQKTNALADDLKYKSESLNSVVDAVKDVGTTVSKFNGTLQDITQSFDKQVEESKEKVSQVIQWSNVILELRDKWKAKRQEKNMITPSETGRVRSR